MDAPAVVVVDVRVQAPIVQWTFVLKVYVMLLFTVFFAMLGLIVCVRFDQFIEVGTWINFIVFVCWINTLETEMWFLRCICIFITSILFGASIGSLQDHYQIDQRYIVTFFASCIFLVTHHVLALCTRDFNLIDKINAFALPLFIFFAVIVQEAEYIIKIILGVPFICYVLLWRCRDFVLVWRYRILIHVQCISILSMWFKYPILYLMYIYVFVLFILYHLITHTQQTIRLSSSYLEGDISVTGTCITFYTGILGRTLSPVIDFACIIFQWVWVGISPIIMQIWQESCTYVKVIKDGLIVVITGVKDYLVRVAGDVIFTAGIFWCIIVFVTSILQG